MPRERGGGGLAVSGPAAFSFCLEAWRRQALPYPPGGYTRRILVRTRSAPVTHGLFVHTDHGRDLPERCPALAHDSRLWTFEALTVFSSENCPNNQK